MLVFILSSTAIAQSAKVEEPVYLLDKSSHRVLALKNLYPASDCHRAYAQGTVVMREFDKDGLRVIGFVLESKDGTRDHVNVDVNPDQMSMVAREWVYRGLQTLLKEGRRVRAVVMLCGAAGRISMAHEIY
jgi:hypothetical protein